MKKIYDWIRTNKIMSGVIFITFFLIMFNIVLMAQFVNILNAVI